MEPQTENADAAAVFERGCRLAGHSEESDAVEGSTIVGGDLDAERDQILSRIAHQTLAASLVYGRPEGVGDQNIQTFLRESDRGGEAGGTATDDECVTVDHSAPPPTTPAITSRSRIPAPSPPAHCAIPAWAGDGSSLHPEPPAQTRRRDFLPVAVLPRKVSIRHRGGRELRPRLPALWGHRD